jgi:predicted kinase
MPKLYVLVGVPGSGKSTWARSQEWYNDCAYISTDVWIDIEASKQGKTYSEVFEEFMPSAIHIMTEHVKLAQHANQDIIWDQTSTTVSSRTRKFNMLPDYHAIAVVFRTPEEEELARRLATRPGKVIPEHVLHDMIWNFEMPTEEEGFKEIWYAD